jgi:hypothetical protein
MKTTVELPDPLLREAKAYALERGVPLREVFETALVMLLRNKRAAPQGFRLKTITTKGEGLQIDGDWSEIRSLIYEGHGG